MKIVGTFYGGCEVPDWKAAERFVDYELLEDMDFTNVKHLSVKDQIFPFDFAGEWHGQKCLIDVTLRRSKPVRTKRLRAWRELGYTPMLLILLPKQMMSVLIEIEESDTWINLTNRTIQKLKAEEWDRSRSAKDTEIKHLGK